uniref:PB1 domain-containing protein n=1 Tax=Kalanchoe fedtschenkoi TaxID=63787 RepID=A0A7N0UA02_KALFE
MAEEETSIASATYYTEATSVSASSSSPTPSSSPKTSKPKIKLRCSHGGKIMVRPPDGHLKYIGGETRVVAVPRDVTFPELMKKLSDLVEGENEMVLKYQLVPEELDTLVSVRTDVDLKHMLEEYDRQEHQAGTPKMRAYLFPSKQVVVETGPGLSSHALEQRYIDAINGIVRATPSPRLRTAPSSARPSFSISSPCSSPKVISPDKVQNPWDASNGPSPKGKGKGSMHRVRSSPTLSHGGESQLAGGGSGIQFGRQYGMYQAYRLQNQGHGHLYHQQQQQQQHGGGGLYSVNSLQPQEFYRVTGRGGLVLGPGAMDRFYPASGRSYNKGSRGAFDDGYSAIDRAFHHFFNHRSKTNTFI